MTLHETIKQNARGKRAIITMAIGGVTLLLAVFSATFAYFSVTANNTATATATTGALKSTGGISLTTTTRNLYMNLDGVRMNQENVGKVYYAVTTSGGTPSATANSFTLATATVAAGETKYNCTYNYTIHATVARTISDGSTEDIRIVFTGTSIAGNSQTYTLTQLLAGDKTLTGTFTSLTYGTPQTIKVYSTVTNVADKQDDFVGNTYTITITPKADVQGFSCVAVK